MRIFQDTQGAANSADPGQIWPNFKLIREFIAVLINGKNGEDPIKNESARVLTALYIDFSDGQGQLTPRSMVEYG